MSPANFLRMFTAVELPGPTRDAVAALGQRIVEECRTSVRERRAGAPERRAGVRGLREVPPENLHVTVRFLGDVERSQVDPIVEALRAAVSDVPAAVTEVAGVSAFPSRRHPRVVWRGVADPAPLAELEAAVGRALRGVGFGSDDEPYTPHVTLARVNDRSTADALAPHLAAAHRDAPRFGELVVDHLTVFQSHLDRDTSSDGRGAPRRRAPHYQVLARLPLGRSLRPGLAEGEDAQSKPAIPGRPGIPRPGDR